jgi:hypothetical protein
MCNEWTWRSRRDVGYETRNQALCGCCCCCRQDTWRPVGCQEGDCPYLTSVHNLWLSFTSACKYIEDWSHLDDSKNSVITSQRTHCISVTETSRLMLFIVRTYGRHKSSLCLTVKILHLRCRDQPVNAVYGNSRCLLWEPYGTHKYSSYLTGSTLDLRYGDQPLNAI